MIGRPAGLNRWYYLLQSLIFALRSLAVTDRILSGTEKIFSNLFT